MFHKIHNAKIAAIRAAVPANEIKLEEEAEYYGASSKKTVRLNRALGMDRRRVCPPGVTASDLCAYAAEDLLAERPDARMKIDALIFVSQSPDWHQPATACELQHRLHLSENLMAFDVNQGCSGYIYGLSLAMSLIAAGSASNALLLVGDANARGRDPRNRITAPVFGDGGSATLLTRDEGEQAIFGFGTDGSGFETIIAPAGQARIPFVGSIKANEDLVADNFDENGNPWQLFETYMDGGAVFNFTMDRVPAHLLDLLAYAKLTQKDIDWLILHQANKQIVNAIAAACDFSIDKTPSASFSKFGNLAAASIPAAICDTLHDNADPGQVILCGYGVGLSWASCLCNLHHFDCREPLVYEADPARPTREQRVRRWQKIFRGEISRHDKI